MISVAFHDILYLTKKRERENHEHRKGILCEQAGRSRGSLQQASVRYLQSFKERKTCCTVLHALCNSGGSGKIRRFHEYIQPRKDLCHKGLTGGHLSHSTALARDKPEPRAKCTHERPAQRTEEEHHHHGAPITHHSHPNRAVHCTIQITMIVTRRLTTTVRPISQRVTQRW